MNWNLVSFANEEYLNKQNYLNSYAESSGLKTHSYSYEWLKHQDFYKENEDVFNESPGLGYFLWKPFIILDAMSKIPEGEMILYSDVGDMFHPDLIPYVNSIMGDDFCLLLIGGFPNKVLTKRDCFVYMDCDEEDYWDSIQLEAGMSFWKVCDQAKNLVSEWLEYCKDRRIISDDENVSGKENFPSFREHHHDQSILTNLAVKYGLPAVEQNSQIRHYLECNVDYWYERNEKFGFTLNRPIDTLLISLKDGSPHA
jgi:hypothetical protein